MPTPRAPQASHTICPVENCSRIVRNFVVADGEPVPLCDYHYQRTAEMFGDTTQSGFRQRDKSIVDWRDNIYHSDIPEVLHGADPRPFYVPFVEKDWEND